MTLTKNDFIEEMTALGFTKKRSIELVETLLEMIKRTLESGEDVLISGFGKFQVRDKKPRRGRNPATGDDLLLRKRRVITFRCSPVLREKMDKSNSKDTYVCETCGRRECICTKEKM